MELIPQSKLHITIAMKIAFHGDVRASLESSLNSNNALDGIFGMVA